MWTAKWILDDYEQGAQSVKWDMYMIYPGLRNYFDEIEARAEVRGEVRTGSPVQTRSRTRWNLYSRLVKGFGG